MIFMAAEIFILMHNFNLLLDAKRKLGEILSAFEFSDSNLMDLVLNHLEGVRNPLPHSMHKFYVLIETTGSDESYDKKNLKSGRMKL
ncbi:hypothetical protein ACSBR2_000160 [Camellia fascicularis]